MSQHSHSAQTATAPLPGKEDCPGHLQWSAFGANYPDTVCASVVEWPDGYQGSGLCDADDDLREGDVPCPFCDPEMFAGYIWDEDVTLLWAADESPVSAGTEVHFHDGQALWWTATHPARGEERILARQSEGNSVRGVEA